MTHIISHIMENLWMNMSHPMDLPPSILSSWGINVSIVYYQWIIWDGFSYGSSKHPKLFGDING